LTGLAKNFRVRNAKDIETAEESLFFNTGFVNRVPDFTGVTPKLSVTYQQENIEGIDELFEKKR
jgi:hypothetical protein